MEVVITIAMFHLEMGEISAGHLPCSFRFFDYILTIKN